MNDPLVQPTGACAPRSGAAMTLAEKLSELEKRRDVAANHRLAIRMILIAQDFARRLAEAGNNRPLTDMDVDEVVSAV
jgi:hypothetical protein